MGRIQQNPEDAGSGARSQHHLLLRFSTVLIGVAVLVTWATARNPSTAQAAHRVVGRPVMRRFSNHGSSANFGGNLQLHRGDLPSSNGATPTNFKGTCPWGADHVDHHRAGKEGTRRGKPLLLLPMPMWSETSQAELEVFVNTTSPYADTVLVTSSDYGYDRYCHISSPDLDDSWENLPRRILNAWGAMSGVAHAGQLYHSHIVKLDLDTWLNWRLVIPLLAELRSEVPWYVGNCRMISRFGMRIVDGGPDAHPLLRHPTKTLAWNFGGHGYALSIRTLTAMAVSDWEWCQRNVGELSRAEDGAVGGCLHMRIGLRCLDLSPPHRGGWGQHGDLDAERTAAAAVNTSILTLFRTASIHRVPPMSKTRKLLERRLSGVSEKSQHDAVSSLLRPFPAQLANVPGSVASVFACGSDKGQEALCCQRPGYAKRNSPNVSLSHTAVIDRSTVRGHAQLPAVKSTGDSMSALLAVVVASSSLRATVRPSISRRISLLLEALSSPTYRDTEVVVVAVGMSTAPHASLFHDNTASNRFVTCAVPEVSDSFQASSGLLPLTVDAATVDGQLSAVLSCIKALHSADLRKAKIAKADKSRPLVILNAVSLPAIIPLLPTLWRWAHLKEHVHVMANAVGATPRDDHGQLRVHTKVDLHDCGQRQHLRTADDPTEDAWKVLHLTPVAVAGSTANSEQLLGAVQEHAAAIGHTEKPQCGARPALLWLTASSGIACQAVDVTLHLNVTAGDA